MGNGDSKPTINFRDSYQKEIPLAKYQSSIVSQLVSKSATQDTPIPASLFFTILPEFEVHQLDATTGEYIKARYLQSLESCCLTQAEDALFSCEPFSKKDTSNTCDQFFQKNCIDVNSESLYCNKTLERIVALSNDYQYKNVLQDYYSKYKHDIAKMRVLLRIMRTKATRNNGLDAFADEILVDLHKYGMNLKCAMNESHLSACVRPECVLEDREFLSASNLRELETCKNSLCINQITFANEEREANINSMCYVELDPEMLRDDFREGFRLPFRILPLSFFLCLFLILVLFQSLNG